MEITDFLGIAVVGGFLTAVIELIKWNYPTEKSIGKFLVIFLSLVLGGGYVWLRSTPYFETTVLVLATSSTVYALVVK